MVAVETMIDLKLIKCNRDRISGVKDKQMKISLFDFVFCSWILLAKSQVCMNMTSKFLYYKIKTYKIKKYKIHPSLCNRIMIARRPYNFFFPMCQVCTIYTKPSSIYMPITIENFEISKVER